MSSSASKSLQFEAFYAHPQQRVWEALTSPELIARWLMPNDFKAEVGHEFSFSWESKDEAWQGKVYCRVLEVEPPRLLSYTWSDSWDFLEDGNETVVSWELEPQGEGTRVVLHHSGFDSPGLYKLHEMLSGGWKEIVESFIPAVLSGESPHIPD